MARYACATPDHIYPVTSPAGLPPPGYSAPAVVRGVITCDRLLVDLVEDGVEIELVLAGLTPDPATEPAGDLRQLTPLAAWARDWVHDAIAAAGLRHHVFLPRPRRVGRWLPSIEPGSRHVGLLFLAGGQQSLNSRIAQAGICRYDDACPYLSPSWNQPHVAA